MIPILRLFRFACVGIAAMFVHLAVVMLLVPAGLHALVANAAGFALAFQVSYVGHRGWTFQDSSAPNDYRRMFSLSLVSFAMNEALYAALLHWTPLDYRASLAMVLVPVAAFTFIGSRFWVFPADHREP